MTNRKYAVLILSHGRADNVTTYKSLRKHGYTGQIYIVIDDEDPQKQKYYENFGNEVIEFSKAAASEYTDTADLKTERDVVVFARNTCHQIAQERGLTHFIEMDDDYFFFGHRAEDNGRLREIKVKKLDEVFSYMFDFLDVSNALAVAPAQGGDYIGGAQGGVWKKRLRRKCMNAFFCRVDRPFKFYGRLNEDTTTYTYLGQQGKLFFTVADFMLNQTETQAQTGGLTEAYLRYGTYVKSFYSILYSPSCVKIASMGSPTKTKKVFYRIHHLIDGEKCYPKILSERYKKR